MNALLPSLILPVENQVREFDAKLLLACAAAERGFEVVIGSLSFVEFLLPFLRPGIYVAKSLTPIGERMLRLARRLGHDVVAWDEESLVRYDAPGYCDWRYARGAFAQVSHLFAWGEDDAALFAAYHASPAIPIHAVGNPRTDLLRPPLREYYRPAADALRRAHGEFILVNTNFAFVNNFVPSQNLWQGPGQGEAGRGVSRTGRGMDAAYARAKATHVQQLFDALRALVPVLARRFGDRRIIVRPHPSEDFAAWRVFEREHANVHVIHEGSVAPWLMACGALVHNGCTTAVEAAVLERPAVAYRPVIDAAHDYALPNVLSHDARTEGDVLRLLEEILDGRRNTIDASSRDTVFARHLAGLQGPLAVDRIVGILLEHCAHTRARSPRSMHAWFRSNGRTLLKLGNMLRPGHRGSLRYHRQRFPRLSNADVQARIARLGELLGRFADVEASPLGPHVFRVGRRLRQGD